MTTKQIQPPNNIRGGTWRGTKADRAYMAHLKWLGMRDGSSRHAGSAHIERVKRIAVAWHEWLCLHPCEC